MNLVPIFFISIRKKCDKFFSLFDFLYYTLSAEYSSKTEKNRFGVLKMEDIEQINSIESIIDSHAEDMNSLCQIKAENLIPFLNSIMRLHEEVLIHYQSKDNCFYYAAMDGSHIRLIEIKLLSNVITKITTSERDFTLPITQKQLDQVIESITPRLKNGKKDSTKKAKDLFNSTEISLSYDEITHTSNLNEINSIIKSDQLEEEDFRIEPLKEISYENIFRIPLSDFTSLINIVKKIEGEIQTFDVDMKTSTIQSKYESKMINLTQQMKVRWLTGPIYSFTHTFANPFLDWLNELPKNSNELTISLQKENPIKIITKNDSFEYMLFIAPRVEEDNNEEGDEKC